MGGAEMRCFMFEFTEDFLLGEERIDNEHRHLFDLLADAMYMLNNEYKDDRYSDIKELLWELEKYSDVHFSHEEEYMRSIRDPELILQRTQHMFFREKILDFLMRNIDEDGRQAQVLKEIVNFLAKWLYRHIISSDMMIGKLPPLEEWMLKENPCEFTEEYMTGNPLIDGEHKTLFEIAGRANKLVRTWSPEEKYDGIVAILDELKGYAATHFADEEEYMESIGYDGLDVQKRAHRAFIARFEDIDFDKVGENPQTYLQSLIEFLLGWLINHILQVDKKIPV